MSAFVIPPLTPPSIFNAFVPHFSDFATRQCSVNGLWLDDDGKEGPDPSWTNFSACFTPELTKVIEGFYANISGTQCIINAEVMVWKIWVLGCVSPSSRQGLGSRNQHSIFQHTSEYNAAFY